MRDRQQHRVKVGVRVRATVRVTLSFIRLVLTCLVLSCLVLSCLVLSCLALSWLVLLG